MKIAIGSDHRGFELKNYIKKEIPGITWIDVGCDSPERCDYPIFAQALVQYVQQQPPIIGILLCGSGIGMAIAANRCKNMYAGVAWSPEVARKAREDDNVNILVLPADFIGKQEALDTIRAWLGAEFKQERYQERLAMIDEAGNC